MTFQTSPRSKNFLRVFSATFAALFFFSAADVLADDIIMGPPKVVIQSPDARPKQIDLVIKDHRFDPTAITIMPDEKIILHIVNKDDSAEKFESRYMKREKIIPGNTAEDVAIGPLPPGVYDFDGAYHTESATGTITVPQPGWNFSYHP